MKKLLGILFVAVATMYVFVGCSNDEEQQVAMSKEQQFESNLNRYVYNQMAIINEGKTRAEGELTEEELKAIAQSLDSVTCMFFVQNFEIISENIPIIDITDEERDLISADVDEYLSFIEKNFSTTIYDIISASINNDLGGTRASSDLLTETMENGTALEQYVAATAVVQENLDDLTTSEYKNNGNSRYQAMKALCDQQYDFDMQACDFSFWGAFVAVLTTAGEVGGTTALAGAAIGGSVTFGAGSVPTATVAGGAGAVAGAAGEIYNQYNQYQAQQECKAKCASKRAACYEAAKYK